MKKPFKILVCPDSFKGSLSAKEVADTIFSALYHIFPDAQIITKPLGDGGEGSMHALYDFGGWNFYECSCHNALMKDCKAKYLVSENKSSAYIESAEAIGLYGISPADRNPLNTTSYGLGEILNDAIGRGCKNIFIGLGGSATNDCGMGMLSALGFDFFDRDGQKLLGRGIDLLNVERVSFTGDLTAFSRINLYAVCDVENPLYGQNGASCIYAPQKGASYSEVETLDRGLKHFSDILASSLHIEFNPFLPGSGAAGGIGFALTSILGGEFKKGAEFILKATGCSQLISQSDLVVTGEGSFDVQSLMGKIVGTVIKESGNHVIPVIIFAGKVNKMDSENRSLAYTALEIADSLKSLELNMKPDVAKANLFNAVSDFFLKVSR